MPPRDPYAIASAPPEYNPRGDSMNGYTGSKTPGSLANAAINRAPSFGGGGNVFAEMVQYGRRPAAMRSAGVDAKSTKQVNPGLRTGGVATIPGANPFAIAPVGPVVTYAGPNGTTHTPPGARWQPAPRMPWEPSPVPPGMTRPFGEDAAPQTGTISRYNPFLPAPDALPINEPGPGNYPLADRFRPAPPIPQGSGPLNPNYQYARDDSGGGFNPDGPALPPPAPTPPPAPRGSRPGGRPSTQLPPQPVFNPTDGGSVTYADPRGGTTHTRPLSNPFPVFQPGDGRSVTYADPQGGTTHTAPGGSSPFPVIGMDGGRTPSGMQGPQYTEDGRLLGSNGVGLRYRPNSVPVDQQGASGERAQNYVWKDGKLVPADWSGTATPPAATTTGTGTPSVPGANTNTGTTTGQFGAPNNTTTFDPNVLPSSNVGSWLDPVQQDAMDRLTRQLRHEGSLTGATNSGGFIPGMAEKLAPVANQFAAQKGQLMFQDQQAKADRLLDKYKFDNAQQLQSWIEQNRQELERYGIDQNVLLGRYNADKQIQAAGIGARASTAAARYGADASRYNSLLDYLSSQYSTDANYDLGMGNLGLGFYNAGNQYNLGLYGADIDRENNMMNYLSRIYGMSPDMLRLLMQGDPSQLIPGMSPGNTVTVL